MCLDEETTLVAPFLGKGDPLLFFFVVVVMYICLCVCMVFVCFILDTPKQFLRKKKTFN